MNTQDRENELRRHGVSPTAIASLVPAGMPSAKIEIDPTRPAEPGRSCLRGNLNLPEGWWLEGRRPLGFVGCIVLSDVAPFVAAEGFPGRGALLFHYDGRSSVFERDGVGWKVEYRPEPPFCGHPGGEGACFPLRFVPEWTLPSSDSSRYVRLGIRDADTEKYEDILRERCRASFYRVGGLPDPLGMDLSDALDASRESQGLPKARQWVLLLQLDSQEKLGIDCLNGRAYFLIAAEDLQRLDFSKVVVVTQRT